MALFAVYKRFNSVRGTLFRAVLFQGKCWISMMMTLNSVELRTGWHFTSQQVLYVSLVSLFSPLINPPGSCSPEYCTSTISACICLPQRHHHGFPIHRDAAHLLRSTTLRDINHFESKFESSHGHTRYTHLKVNNQKQSPKYSVMKETRNKGEGIRRGSTKLNRYA